MNALFVKLMGMDQRSNNYFTSLDNPLLRKALGILTHLGTGAFWVTIYGVSLILFHKEFAQLIFTLIVGENRLVDHYHS